MDGILGEYRGLQINKQYRHWKGKLYWVEGVYKHTETGEQMVIYTAQYPPYQGYVRPYNMFMDEVEKGRESENVTGQHYRFEPYTGDDE